MFESVEVVAEDAVSCADVLVASIADERRAVARRFAAVAAWADCHVPAPDDPSTSRLQAATGRSHQAAVSSFIVAFADGTPVVARAGVVELGMLLQTSTGSAQALLRDVLELRHRLPRHWRAVQALEVDGWKARQVATLTRRLSRDQARAVDAQVIEAVTGLPWGRAKDVVEGKVIAADPEAHKGRLAEDENRRFVSTRRRSNAAGLRTMIARGHAGDIARLEGMIAYIAQQLEIHGDTSPADFRRAKALAMLANPALTCVFLARAQDGAASHATHLAGAAEPVEPEPAEPEPVEPEGAPSAVELALEFGRVLQQLGGKALDRLRPRSVLYVHLAAEAVEGLTRCGVARVDDPFARGPISIDQLRRWLRHDRVTVKPVIDPSSATPVDAYEVPAHLREAGQLINPYEVFPYGTLSARQSDFDHPIPYVAMDDGGPPGQTALTNLGPLGRRHHLAKTFDGFTVHQAAIGLYLWRAPTGHWYQVDHRGTRHLGRYDGAARPAVLETAERHPPAGMTLMEARLREAVVRHAAA
ncbi:MAG: hypothetical protein AVDCRST_MAG47-2451 [uncultured Nocardioidaceae bacterium]|uniref:DUF222 domain-containing protein n=1 Tax=uncultured Nocardioidaceae bacterium TaxID=253824 RepID=A0A6J4NES6_9ACTN|nr:MAG: hypothetical protein AVDCRST_MAG47-2451 [uncultured Nocardioidaceae bacterium]